MRFFFVDTVDYKFSCGIFRCISGENKMRIVFGVVGLLAIIPLAFAATICFAIVMPLIVVFLAIIIAIEYIIDLPRRLPNDRDRP